MVVAGRVKLLGGVLPSGEAWIVWIRVGVSVGWVL